MENVYDLEAVQAFLAQCDELENSSFIMSYNKIRMLLKCLAYYPELRNLVDECKYNFDFDREYSRSIVSLGTTNAFRLPLSNRKKVALVVSLLLDFDVPRRDFVRFVMEFWPSSDRAKSYQGFVNAVRVPFKKAVVDMLMAKDELTPVAEIREKDAQKLEVNIALAERTSYLIDSAVAAVKEAQPEETVSYELQFMLDTFATVLEQRDAVVIKAYWMGLKHYLENQKIAAKEVKEIDALMKDYLLS